MISRGSLEQRIAALEQAERQRRDSMVATGSTAITEAIAPCYLPLHEDIQAGQHRFYNLPGGRGSCKSSFVSLEIVDGIQNDPTGQSNAIVFRRVAGTMRDSVFSQIAWAIDLLGVSHLWKPTVSPMAYEYLPTGAQILFRGLDDASKLKSIKPRHGFSVSCGLRSSPSFPARSSPGMCCNRLSVVTTQSPWYSAASTRL